ncbi:poly(A)-specific ribonuclease PARN-like [Atheta coriaria]|uniref:poly(A)-specific ribonuclease PARN-like n=1 Tax=Dalotia coriaria TaxID=877792 RepID=UPI0031F45BF3
MEITKSNLLSELPGIEEAIKNASFLAIDCEFTGLITSCKINPYDTPEEYYQKIRLCSKDFLVIQFGLSAFRYDTGSKSFKEKSYNFFLFPRKFNKNLPDESFLCQVSTMTFLINAGFDFNKLFKEGIPYLNREGRLQLQTYLDEAQKIKNKEPVPIPDHLKSEIDDVFKEIKNFIKSGDEERVLNTSSAFCRRLIYQSLQERVGDVVTLETRFEGDDRTLVVSHSKTGKEIAEIHRKIMREAIGFSEIIQLISKSRKPVVGHNMMLDVFHTINRFLVKLPEDYKSFKDCAHCLFPCIFDTKHIGSHMIFKDIIQSTVLSKMLHSLLQKPFNPPVVENDIVGLAKPYSVLEPREHEAGYDAYITGLCFISLWDYIGKKIGYKGSVFENINVLGPYYNKIYQMHLRDVPYICLDAPDVRPSREHVFYISFSKTWKVADIVQLFSPFGFVFVSWIDATSAYVALNNRENYPAVLKSLAKSTAYKIMTYSQHQAILGKLKPDKVGDKELEQSDDLGVVVTRDKRKRKSTNDDQSGSAQKQRKNLTESNESVLFNSLLVNKTPDKAFAEDDSWE